MKYASSIRYGGQLIDALDVDYNAYKHLGLLCPNCKEPVFLQAGSLRQLNSKISLVSPHFKHFAVSDPILIKQCESRVANYDAKELERRATISRNQRIKLMQKYFWQIFNSKKLDSYRTFGEAIERQEKLFLKNANTPANFFANWAVEECINYLIKNKCFFKEKLIPNFVNNIKFFSSPKDINTCSDLKKYMVKYPDDDLAWAGDTLEEKFNFIHCRIQEIEEIKSSLDLKLHQAILGEVLDFLLAKSSRHTLKRLLLSAVLRIDPKKYDDKFHYIFVCFDCFVKDIGEISWAKEFAQRQNQTEPIARSFSA